MAHLRVFFLVRQFAHSPVWGLAERKGFPEVPTGRTPEGGLSRFPLRKGADGKAPFEVRLNRGAGGDVGTRREVVREVLGALREQGCFSDVPRRAVELAEALGLEVGEDPWKFGLEVLEEASKGMRRALGGLWRSFGSQLLPREAEVGATNGERVKVSYPSRRGAPWAQADTGSERTAFRPLRLPPEGLAFEIEVWPTLVEVRVRLEGAERAAPGLVTVGERVVFGTEGLDGVRRTLEGVRYLRPFFSAVGLRDLEGALRELAVLGEGEVRAQGEYTLARRGERWALGRGRFLGDSEQDGALLLGDRVSLRFPGDVEVSFRGRFSNHSVALREVEVRWGEEAVRFHRYAVFGSNLHRRDPVGDAIRSAFSADNVRIGIGGKPTPRMEALLGVLVRSEDPVELLRSGRAAPHATAELFLDL